VSLQVGDLVATLRLVDSLSGPIKSAQAAAQSAFAGMQQSSSAATSNMSAAQKQLQTELKLVQEHIKALEQTSKSGYLTQTKGLEQARTEAAKLTDMIGRLGTAMKAEEAATTAAIAATQRHTQAQATDEKATQRRGEALQTVANGMRAAGDAMTIGVSAPLLAATAASIHFATQFETNTTRLVTLSGVSEENMQGMKRAMLEMAPAVGVGPGELSKALLAVTSTGLRGAEALDVLKISAKASAVGLGETEIVARTIVSAMNAYGPANLSAARAADVLYRTVVAGNAEAATLAPVLGRVMGVASQAGISFEELGASIATFTRIGVPADVAVTGLQNTIMHLVAPTKEAKKAMEEIRKATGDAGISADGLRKELREKGLLETLQHLMKVTGGNIDVLDLLIGDVRGLSMVLGTAGAQADTYAANLVEIRDGTMGVNDAHQRMKLTTGQIWNEIQAQIEVVFVEIGTQLLPILKDLAPTLKNLLENVLGVVKAFADLPAPVQTFLARPRHRRWAGPLGPRAGPRHVHQDQGRDPKHHAPGVAGKAPRPRHRHLGRGRRDARRWGRHHLRVGR
jgi:TP901 family phage tail tape measure protein